MKKLFVLLAVMGLFAFLQPMMAQPEQSKDSTESLVSDTLAADSAMALIDADLNGPDEGEGGGLHKLLKTKFIEGSAGFMSLVALALSHRSCFLYRAYHLSDALRDQCQEADAGYRCEVDGERCGRCQGPVPADPWSCRQYLLSGAYAYQRAVGPDRPSVDELWFRTDFQYGERVYLDQTVYRRSSLPVVSLVR